MEGYPVIGWLIGGAIILAIAYKVTPFGDVVRGWLGLPPRKTDAR